jgi:quinol monooxygenase YgiN
MSVHVIQVVPGDTSQFRAFMEANGARIEELTQRAKDEGCLAHRFAVGDGEVVIIDEWESAEAFQGFITAPELQEVIGQMGAQGEPRITVAEVESFAGEF